MLQASRSLGRLAALAALLLTANAFAYDDEKPHGFWHAEPGNIDYYVLVLGWSPTYCLHEGDARNDMQCDSEQSHDFVLHGLWPQYAEGWPEDCYTGQRPWVPSAVIEKMRTVMPSKALIIHEYNTHGTCTGLAPGAFYDVVRKAYDQVRIPAAFDDPKTQRFMSPEKVESAFHCRQ